MICRGECKAAGHGGGGRMGGWCIGEATPERRTYPPAHTRARTHAHATHTCTPGTLELAGRRDARAASSPCHQYTSEPAWGGESSDPTERGDSDLGLRR